MKKNYIFSDVLETNKFVNLGSTATTSITFITGISSLTTSSTKLTFTKQTAYMYYGNILNLSTVTTTSILTTG